MRKFWLKHREPDPAGDDATPAWVMQETTGDPGTEYETPGRRQARAETDGHQLGAARVPKEEAVGETSGARGWIRGGAEARKGLLKASALGAKLAAIKRIKALPGRLAANAAQRTGSKERLERLCSERLPEARARETEQSEALRAGRSRYAALPRPLKGYFHSMPLLIAVEVAVVAFDGGALYGALKHAGFSGVVLIYVMAAVPVLIAAVNHALGVAAGAIGLKLTKELKLKAAGMAFAATLCALLCALIMLAIFRADATSAQNVTLANWTRGDFSSASNFLISPSWLGPAQIAGSFAAILMVCFWTLAQEGRELRGEIGRLEGLADQREAERGEVEVEIEREHERDTELVAQAAHFRREAAEAQADVDVHPELLDARLEAERGHEQAAAGRLRTSFTYSDQIYRNGGIVRMAVATVTRFGRRFTPPPGDARGEPFRQPSPNGHKAMSDDELSSLIGD